MTYVEVTGELVEDEVQVRIDVNDIVSEHYDEIKEEMERQGHLDDDEHHDQDQLQEMMNRCEAIEGMVSRLKEKIGEKYNG